MTCINIFILVWP